YTATLGHSGVQRVPSPVKGATIEEVRLFGHELAITLNSGHSLGDVQAWLQELDGTRRHLVRQVSSGEADRVFHGLAFDGGALYFAQSCLGDPSGCPGHGFAYRYASGKLTKASIPLDVAGFAQAAGTSYWVTENYGDCLNDVGEDAPCDVQSATLAFN